MLRLGMTYRFQAVVRMKYETPGGVEVTRALPLVVVVGGDKRILTFYPSRTVETAGEVIYP